VQLWTQLIDSQNQRLLNMQEADLQQGGGAAPEAAAPPQPLAPAERAALLQRLPPDVAPAASAAVAALAGSSPEVGLTDHSPSRAGASDGGDRASSRGPNHGSSAECLWRPSATQCVGHS
jgi:hypothetical protein